jgi:hypothetical protein
MNNVLRAVGLIVSFPFFSVLALGQSLDRIEGKWNNEGGDNISIEEDQLGGWDAWLGAVGQAILRTQLIKGAILRLKQGIYSVGSARPS